MIEVLVLSDGTICLDQECVTLANLRPVEFNSQNSPASHDLDNSMSVACRMFFRLYSSLNSSWEEINERVRNLLTSPEARERLSIGATDFEIDDVLERRSISLRSSPHCDSTEQRYSL